ncbi:hypothetical protein Xinn_04168 [Xenorhabdus innexi]|uniref:YD repeat-containing protein n=1 Tax=Xenorhabdus innexi TaxID=290109 RepID=A0A2G0MHX3_9GAMM|nr:hypothetical protein Xinn_04168 [Xenorhabdus innexi]
MLRKKRDLLIVTKVMTMTLAFINFLTVPYLHANSMKIQYTEIKSAEIQNTIIYTYDSLGRLISDTTDKVSENHR